MTFVIGVGSQAQHGKDTLSNRLCEKLNEREVFWTRSAFASNVKKVYCDTFGVDLDFVEEWKVKSEIPPGFSMNVRSALQFIGDGFRKIRSTIWLDLTFRDDVPKIISDVRYVNEFVRVKSEGGLNILIGRPDKLSDDPNGSEAQIKPYIEFCLNSFRGKKFVDINRTAWLGTPPPHMECFDIFICNDEGIDELCKIVDEQLVPYVEKFIFRPPSEGSESCLILS